LTEIWND